MSESFKKRILIVDDHPIMRRGLVGTLEAEPGFEVVHQLDSAEEVLHVLDKGEEPDLMLVDVSLPGMNGIELVKNVIFRKPDQKILMISRHDEFLYAERAIRAGAKGYVMKFESADEILKAVKKVLNGGIYLSSELSEKLLMGMATGKKEISDTPLDVLSDRELEVFELTGKGKSTREIAERLHLSVKTVESYRARIKVKLNYDNANELMLHAVKWVDGERENI